VDGTKLHCYPLPAERWTLTAYYDGTGLFGEDSLLWDSLAVRPWSIFLTSINWSSVELKSLVVIALRSRATMKWCSN